MQKGLNWQWAGIYFLQEKSRNVSMIAGSAEFLALPDSVPQLDPASLSEQLLRLE
jgi:hypothetical protein